MSTYPKILVVEDEKNMREFIRRNLEVRQFRVLTATNGLEALSLFHSDAPDLIILDIMMPHMDGLETCLRIRKASTLLTRIGRESALLCVMCIPICN